MDTGLTYRDVVEVLTLMKESGHCRSLDLEIGNLKFSMTAAVETTTVAPRAVVGAPGSAQKELTPSSKQSADAAAAKAGKVVTPSNGGQLILAPTLGVFYRAPEPGAAPFVDIGDEVEPEQPVGLIEVMKLFSTVQAGVRGRIVEILIENGQMVEYNQPIFRVESK